MASGLDSVRFVVGAMTLERLLERVYRRAAGLPAESLREAFEALPIVPGAKEGIAAMRSAGKEVWLLSSGAPDEVVAALAERLGADGGGGIQVGQSEGRLTGSVGGEPAFSTGKQTFVERLLEKRGLDWSQVAVVADDRANLDILRQAGVSVGFWAIRAVRREAEFLVDEPDFTKVASIVNDPAKAKREAQRPTAKPLAEVCRKMIHGLGVLAVFVHPVWPVALNAVLLLSALAYLVGELLRLNGVVLPVVGDVTQQVIRSGEQRRVALAPIALAAGVLGSLWLFPNRVAYAAVLAVAVADSAATLVGIKWGRVRLPYNPRKTLEGVLASFAAAALCALAYLPLGPALAAAVAGALVESLPLGDWDNLFLPLAAGAAAWATLPVA